MNRPHKLRAIMLDWAGTTVDHGSIAPVLALQTLFANHAIALTAEDARRGMGLLKHDHIRTVSRAAPHSAAVARNHQANPTETEVDSLFHEFGPLQMQIIVQHSQLIAGAAETVKKWQDRGLRIGTTTGYTREMLVPVLQLAAEGGYRPDASVCPDEVTAGRPAPWMLMRNAELLNVYTPSSCVKIGDTISDIEEGRNAGMWTIGLTRTGNLIGLDAVSWAQLSAAEKDTHLKKAEEIMRDAGADFVAQFITGCDQILTLIER
jgi:phosphonoacetaldehyde hydrolase